MHEDWIGLEERRMQLLQWYARGWSFVDIQVYFPESSQQYLRRFIVDGVNPGTEQRRRLRIKNMHRKPTITVEKDDHAQIAAWSEELNMSMGEIVNQLVRASQNSTGNKSIYR